LVGASGAGKSSFARRHFLPTETISSDFCRALVSDDENSLDATNDAFALLHYIAAKRLTRGNLTVVDATNVQSEARAPLVALGRAHYVLPVAIVLDVPEETCQARNVERPDRDFGPHVVRNHVRQLRRSIRHLKKEGFRHVWVLSPEQIETVEIERQPLWNNRKNEHGPFDIIGDVHGCAAELQQLLTLLAYVPDDDGIWRHPEGRKVVFVGDLVDRGPGVVEVLNIVMAMCEAGTALCVPGNHDEKLVKKLNGKNVKLAHGLAETLEQFEGQADQWKERVRKFLDGLISHYVLDDGRLVVAHAGMKEEMQGRASGAVRAFAMYGETTGETDEFGLPVRYPWAKEYRGSASVIYGHTPVPEAEWLNNTLNIDTGCVFGGKLTALRYPEKEIVSVPAERVYAEPARPFLADDAEQTAETLTAQQQHDDVLDLADVTGKRIVTTRLNHAITIREENSIAALEVMSRFAADPRWLIYLPPTMSPSETSAEPGLLEHPKEAFAYYQKQGIERVVCEEKHMGSRSVVIVCRDEEVARRRFGVSGANGGLGESGIVYTRTGRRFFEDLEMERALLQRVRDAADAAGLWDELGTDWLCLDCELMPWSAKAQELLRSQYAPLGASARASLAATVGVLEETLKRSDDEEFVALRDYYTQRAARAEKYATAYRHYCWDVESVEDLKLAPFHILASEGHVHTDKDHLWHMETIKRLCEAAGGILLATPYRVVEVGDEASVQGGIEWWEAMTARGGEGMVVKPLDFICKGERGWVQPAVKCRGSEYLRIIYGPEYDAPENLSRLRSRGLGAKRSLAMREFALGIEALERFVRREPLRRVHECTFGVLALESEPVDPRL
jgi:polynucleotide kinase-phosphatase